MKPHARVAWQVIDGQAVLIDLEVGHVLGLNETGSFLWPRLENRCAEELSQELSQEFRVPAARAREDVASFLSLLRQRGFIEG
jgi:hypothetical protein